MRPTSILWPTKSPYVHFEACRRRSTTIVALADSSDQRSLASTPRHKNRNHWPHANLRAHASGSRRRRCRSERSCRRLGEANFDAADTTKFYATERRRSQRRLRVRKQRGGGRRCCSRRRATVGAVASHGDNRVARCRRSAAAAADSKRRLVNGDNRDADRRHEEAAATHEPRQVRELNRRRRRHTTASGRRHDARCCERRRDRCRAGNRQFAVSHHYRASRRKRRA